MLNFTPNALQIMRPPTLPLPCHIRGIVISITVSPCSGDSPGEPNAPCLTPAPDLDLTPRAPVYVVNSLNK